MKTKVYTCLTVLGMFIAVLVPCAVFRFVVFAPFGYYWAYASTHWKVIKNNVELHNGLYNPTIATGEKIASNWGTFAFYWNFVRVTGRYHETDRVMYLTSI
jgi:hypothetical protein